MTDLGWTQSFSELALRRGSVTPDALDRAMRLAEQTGERLDRVALTLGLMREDALAEAYATLLDRALVDASDIPDTPLAQPTIPARFVRHARILPLRATDTHLCIAMADPFDANVQRALAFATGLTVQPHAIVPAELEAALDRLYPVGTVVRETVDLANSDIGDGDLDRLRDMASEAPVIRLVNQLIMRAVEAKASDIHFEASDGGMRVRYRIDGVLREIPSPQATLRAAIVSRIKIMAKLDIAERRLAQDGRIRLPVRGREIDFRVSTTPSVHGESVVLRILDRGNLKLEFAALGFDPSLLSRFLEVLRRPHGILLVTGPTGSGKTTTLYTALSELNAPETKILTVEDPVEYLLPGVNQVQVKPQIGLTFASALRSFLRQDPDIMMIGEIRDLETAQIAVQAALTGHLVLSTVHTNDSASAVTRLLDMGLEDYLLTSTINAIAAQRLVRTLCHNCKEPFPAPPDLRARLNLAEEGGVPVMLHRAVGCAACSFTGFSGRTMIVELLLMSEPLRRLVLRHAEAGELRQVAMEEGMRTMYAHGVAKVLAGVTTIEEVARAVRDT
jgi:general secretion pathway protein E